MAELADAWSAAGKKNVFGQVPEIFEVRALSAHSIDILRYLYAGGWRLEQSSSRPFCCPPQSTLVLI